MIRRETAFDYMKQIFVVYGFCIFTMSIFCILFGESAQEFSTLFALGNKGLSIATMLQFLLLSAIIVTLRFIFFSDGLIRRVPLALRTIAMFTLVILFMVLFIYWFGWFPINMWQPWAMFFLCFGLSAGISTLLSLWKEKLENKNLEEALERLKQEVQHYE